MEQQIAGDLVHNPGLPRGVIPAERALASEEPESSNPDLIFKHDRSRATT
jgi:hypothetical protein